jgi:hypothetical protein
MILLTDALFWRNLHPLTVETISALALPLSIAALLMPAYALALFGPAGFGARLGRLTAVRTVLGAGTSLLA